MNFSQLSNFIYNKFSYIDSSVLMRSQVYWEIDDVCREDYYNELKFETDATWVANGCTKLVLYFNEFPDVVFKIPFVGSIYEANLNGLYTIEDYLYDVSNDSFNLKKFNKFVKYFDGAGNNGLYCVNDYDYCEAEAYISEIAVDANIDDMFAKTYHLGSFFGVEVYVSEKMNNEENEIAKIYRNVSVDSRKKVQSINNNTEFDYEYLLIIVEQYGLDKAQKLIDFIAEYDITDFNPGNVAINAKGQFKIIDYSSYREDL